MDDLELLTPLEQRVWALSQLEEVDPTDRPEARELTAAFETVNESLSIHVDLYRVGDPGTFDASREALQSLRRVDSRSGTNASIALVEADRGVALQEIADAEHLLDRYAADIESPGQRTKAERLIENAERALERGEEVTSSETPDGRQQRQAIKQYEQAWKHASAAIDTVHEEVGLSLSVTAGQHEPHDETITYPISGRLDAPAVAVDTVDVLVDGKHHRTVDVVTSTVPGVPGRFETALELPTTEATLTVIATDESSGQEVSETITLEAPGFANEVYDIELEGPESDVVVTVTGEGIVRSDFEVDDVPAETDRSFHAGPFIHVRNHTTFEKATVEIPLQEGADAHDGNRSVFKWDQHANETWHAVETEIDAENGTAIAEVDSFSYFSVFWVDNWNDAISVTMPLEDRHIDDDGGGTIEPIDLAFVIDVSGSMNGDRIEHARDASQRFVGGLHEDDRVALVSFASDSTLEEPLTADHEAVNESISQLRTGGSTNTGAGLQKAVDELARTGQADEQLIILLADGGTNMGPDPVGIAELADDQGISVHTIGVGTGIDSRELTDIADATGGDFHHVVDSEDLPEVFDRIEQGRISLVDSDDDGLPDAVEEMALGMPVGGPDLLGSLLGLDPEAEDSSGDGRIDGDVIDIEWVTFEENGEPMVTARVTDSIFHPGTGESVTKEVLKLGVFIPSAIDPETDNDVFRLASSGPDRFTDGHVILEGPDHVPADADVSWWGLGSPKHPDWLPDDVEDEDQLHILIENVEIYLQYSHDVKTEDLPTEYHLEFTGGNSDINVYENSGVLSAEETVTRTDIVIAGPDRMDSSLQLPTEWEDIGTLEAHFEIDPDSSLYLESDDEGGTITLESHEPYHYERGVKRAYEDTYDEAMQILRDGLISAAGGGPLRTSTTAARTLLVSESMTTTGGVIVYNRGVKSTLIDVVEGRSPSEADMYNSVIYEHTAHEGTIDVVGQAFKPIDATGAGPVLLRVNEPDIDVED